MIIGMKILVGAARQGSLLLELKISKYFEKGAGPKYNLFIYQKYFYSPAGVAQ